MHTIAWIGVGLLILLLTVWLVVGVVGMLSDPIGRAIAIALTLIGIGAWGVAGAIYLLVKAA